MADEIKKAQEDLREASALTQKVWDRLTRWATWCYKAPVMVLFGVAGGLTGLAVGIPLCLALPALPFWYASILMAVGVVIATIVARRGEIPLEIASGKFKAVARERREAKKLLANNDTRGRQIADDIYLEFLEEVKAENFYRS
jgi:hypothetical protein